jgi:ABC-type transport system involved in multi-copper enzyme maturation permease subunit
MNVNPVLLKELKVRMRSWKAMWMLLAYLSVLALVAAFVLLNTLTNYNSFNMSPESTMGAYIGISIIQFLLISFIAPSLTSGAISGERERQTLDLLLCTRMSPISIISGKLFASLSQIILLVVASLPIFSVVFLFGGISIADIMKLFLFYVVVAITMGAIGIFFSTFIKKTTGSNVTTYAFILFMLFGTLLISVFYVSMKYRYTTQGTPADYVFPLLYSNPLAGFISMLSEQFGGNSIGIPGFRGGASSANMMNLWKINLIFDIALSVILLYFSALKLDPVKKSVKK